jgi:hypothetical protein
MRKKLNVRNPTPAPPRQNVLGEGFKARHLRVCYQVKLAVMEMWDSPLPVVTLWLETAKP